MTYSLNEWVLLFFCYAFIGWLWECFFVSVTSKELVNRGFLYGPWLPIYGFGALIVVILTKRVMHNPILVYLFGMLGATTLEYFTGVLMEKLFKVRYWDYSDMKFNLNGHINLLYTLGWGLGSLVLVYLINPKLENVAVNLSDYFGVTFTVGLGIIFIFDVIKSTRNALDLRKLLEKLTDQSQLIDSISLGLDNIASKINANSQELADNIEDFNNKITSYISNYETNLKKLSLNEKLFIKERLEKIDTLKSDIINISRNQPELIDKKTDKSLYEDKDTKQISLLNKQLSKIKDFKNELSNLEFGFKKLSEKSLFNAKNIIQRNPSIVSKKFRDSLQELKQITSNKDDKEIKY